MQIHLLKIQTLEEFEEAEAARQHDDDPISSYITAFSLEILSTGGFSLISCSHTDAYRGVMTLTRFA